MAEIRWTEEAQRWMQDIYEYIAADNPAAAAERNVRILLYEHYRIASLVTEEKNIDILGVFHGSLDISRYQL